MRNLARISTTIVVALVLDVAYAQRAPTEIETKAAYCARLDQLTVLATPEDQVAKIEDSGMKRSLSNMVNSNKEQLNRVQAYLAPRVPSLDPVALTAAANRAERDYGRYQALVHECTARCKQESDYAGLAKCWEEAMDNCAFGELRDRVDACSNPTWLPSSGSSVAQGTTPRQLILTCHVTGADGNGRDFNYAIDIERSTVNGYRAMITEGEIVWEDDRGGTTFRSTINRYTGRIAVGSKQFPLLGSGECTKSPQRAF